MQTNIAWIDKFKLFFTTSYSTGAIEFPEIIVAKSGEICTETFIVIGPFDTKKEADNAYTYMQTKFFHFFLALRKISQHTTQDVYSFVPLQDFNEAWDDTKLALKYNLSQEEIEYIDKMICPKK